MRAWVTYHSLTSLEDFLMWESVLLLGILLSLIHQPQAYPVLEGRDCHPAEGE